MVGKPTKVRVLLAGFYSMSTVLLERVVLAVVFQAAFQSLFQLFDATTFHEHIPVGTCGLPSSASAVESPLTR